MPFILSLRPQQTEVKLPRKEYDNFEYAWSQARQILNDCKGLYFVGIFFFDDETPHRHVTSVIQQGFEAYTWTQYKYFDKLNRIKDFFVLNGNHFIKLKYKNNMPEKINWKTAAGEYIAIKDMTNTHLLNVYKCLNGVGGAIIPQNWCGRHHSEWIRIFENELELRSINYITYKKQKQ